VIVADTRDPEFDAEWRAFDAIIASTRALVGDTASLEVGYLHGGRIGYCEVEPRNPRARAISLIAEQWLIVTVGDNGGRFELNYTPEHLDLARRIVEATVAGRLQERSAAGRSRVTLTLDDGEQIGETGLSGCATLFMPLPGWKRWGELKTYEAYDA